MSSSSAPAPASGAPNKVVIPDRTGLLAYEHEFISGEELLRRMDAERADHVLYHKNRPIDVCRCAILANAFAGSTRSSFSAAPIIFGRMPTKKGTAVRAINYLLDGQHRVEALRLLGAESLSRSTIQVTYRACRDAAALEEEFRINNLGTPLPMAYLDEQMRRTIEEVYALMRLRYPKAESSGSGSNVKRPYFHPKRFMEEACRCSASGKSRVRELISDRGWTADKFMEVIEKANNKILAEYEDDDSEDKGAFCRRYNVNRGGDCIKAGEKSRFMLGLSEGWCPYIFEKAYKKMYSGECE